MASFWSANTESRMLSRPSALWTAQKLLRSIDSSWPRPASCWAAFWEKSPAFAAALKISSPVGPRYAPAIIFSNGAWPGSVCLASIASSNRERGTLSIAPDSAFMIIDPSGSSPGTLRMLRFFST